jgi:hypothetical protein
MDLNLPIDFVFCFFTFFHYKNFINILNIKNGCFISRKKLIIRIILNRIHL